MFSNYIQIPPPSTTSLNNIVGNINIGAGKNIAVTTSGSDIIIDLVNVSNKSFVDFVSGSDSNTGTSTSPWKTLQHAYNSISPTINTPHIIFICGGNNDSDTSLITGKPNVTLFAEEPTIQVNALTISGGTTNDVVNFFGITFTGIVTWIRNDATAIELNCYNTQFFDLLDFEQNGSGAASSFLYCQDCTLGGGLTVQAGQATLNGTTVYGALDYKDSGAAYFLLNGGDLYTTAISLNGGISAYLYGNMPDSGYSITGTTTSSGTPLINADSSSLPPTLSGAYTLNLVSLASHTSYTPITPGNWASTAPSTVQQGLDRLAAVLKILNLGNPIP